MNNQTRNHLNLQKHIADQDHIIRVRNAEIAALRKRADKAERERDEARRHECSDLDAHWRLDEALASLKEANATAGSVCAAQPRPLTADDITDEARGRAYRAVAALSVSDWDDISGVAKGRAMALVEAVITEITRPEPPTRPEGAEKVEAVLHQYWSGDINGDDLADRIAEEMNR